jgi:hypothetical protein
MKFGPRRPSLSGRIAARTSWKRFARHSLGLKAPRGWGWVTDPRKAAYNRIYNRTTFDIFKPHRAAARLAAWCWPGSCCCC